MPEKMTNCKLLNIIYTVHGCFLIYLLHIKGTSYLIRGYKVFQMYNGKRLLDRGKCNQGVVYLHGARPLLASVPHINSIIMMYYGRNSNLLLVLF